jgi:hypothetical protein
MGIVRYLFFSVIDTFQELFVLDMVRKSPKSNACGESESSISVPVEGS